MRSAKDGTLVAGVPIIRSTNMPGLKIIIADDNADAATTMSIILNHSGYDAHAVYAAPMALALAKELHPHVMLIDIEMPKMDGYQLARAVRQDPHLKEALLIAVTGYGGDHHRSESFAAGFDHHLLKPIDTDEMVTLIEKYTRGSRVS